MSRSASFYAKQNLFDQFRTCGGVTLRLLDINVAICNSTRPMACIVSDVLSWSMLDVFRYTRVPKPVHCRYPQSLSIVFEPFLLHLIYGPVEALLYNQTNLARAGYSASATRLMY